MNRRWSFGIWGGTALLGIALLVVGAHIWQQHQAMNQRVSAVAVTVLRQEAFIGSRSSDSQIPSQLTHQLVPGSQAALWTDWVWSQSHPKTPLRYAIKSVRFLASGITASVNSPTSATVSLAFTVTRSLAPKGQSQVTGAATVYLSRSGQSWQVYGLTYNYSPRASITSPSSAYQWDLWHLNPTARLPQGT